MWVYVMISVGPAGRVIVQRGKNINSVISLDSIKVINIKHCIMVLLDRISRSQVCQTVLTDQKKEKKF